LLLSSCGLGARGLGFFLIFDLGPMRLVTGVAGETPGVIGRDDLGKSLGLCAVGLVTARADDGGVGQLWLYRGRIVSVLALRFVAGPPGEVWIAAPRFL